MNTNKVDFGGKTLIDLTNDTVTPETLAEGVTAHDASGEIIEGEAELGFSGTPTAGDTPVIYADGAYQSAESTLADTGLSITIKKAGTYRIKWNCAGGNGLSNTLTSQLYLNGIAVGEEIITSTTGSYSMDLTCAAGDKISLYFAGYKYAFNYFGGCGGLCACVDWDNGF